MWPVQAFTRVWKSCTDNCGCSKCGSLIRRSLAPLLEPHKVPKSSFLLCLIGGCLSLTVAGPNCHWAHCGNTGQQDLFAGAGLEWEERTSLAEKTCNGYCIVSNSPWTVASQRPRGLGFLLYKLELRFELNSAASPRSSCEWGNSSSCGQFHV